MLRETHPLSGEAIENGRSDSRLTVAAELTPAQVIGEDEDHVRRRPGVPIGCGIAAG